MSREHKLSRYGKGKFVYNVDAYAHTLSLDGGADLGESDGPLGCHTLIERNSAMISPNAAEIEQHSLTVADRLFLASQAGAILHEDSQGFVSVEWFETVPMLTGAWAAIEDEHEQADAEQEDETEEDS